MKPLPHVYVARLFGGPDGYATVTAPGVPDLRTAAPADFDEAGDAWSPELVAPKLTFAILDSEINERLKLS
jgi:hypothetical protein